MKQTRTRWWAQRSILILPLLLILNLHEAHAASEDEIVAMDLLTVQEPRSQADSQLREILRQPDVIAQTYRVVAASRATPEVPNATPRGKGDSFCISLSNPKS